MIWSDPEIQAFSRNFVCVVDDVFYLNPPETVTKIANPESVQLFRHFLKSAPEDVWPAETATHQGLYIMDPNCEFLYGKFASQTNKNARQIIATGWKQWAAKPEALKSQDVPLDYTPIVGGLAASKYRLKLRVSYRDLPRGDIKRPGDAQFPNPYNLGWYDISKQELRKMLTGDGDAVFKKLVLATMKDAVRGEMHRWKSSDWQWGKVKATPFRQDGRMAFYYIEGQAQMAREGTALSYSPKIFGFAGYDFGKQDFREFQMIAVGQRTGAGSSNGRASDLGPAPMAVGLRMHHAGL